MPMLKETYNFDKKLYSETKKPKSMIPDEAKETYEYLAKLRFLKTNLQEIKLYGVSTMSIRYFLSLVSEKNVLMILKQSLKR